MSGPATHGTTGPAAAPPVRRDVALELVGGRERIGCKGPGAEAWLRDAGFDLPAGANRFVADASLLIARLGYSEFFLEAAAGSPPLAALAAGLERAPAGVYPVLREDWRLTLCGADVHQVLAQVCNVDFAALDARSNPVVMTMMIGVAVLVVPLAAAGAPAYAIWCDPSYGPYLSGTLGSVVVESGGIFKGGAA